MSDDLDPRRKLLTEPEAEMRRLSRRGLLWTGVALAAGYAGYRLLNGAPTEGGLPMPFRKALEWNEKLWSNLQSERLLAPTFPIEQARDPKVNGGLGLSGGFDPAAWTLRVEGMFSPSSSVQMSIEEIRAMPFTRICTEFKCVEGWSQIVSWGGVKVSDFMRKFGLGASLNGQAPTNLPNYLYFETPDAGYYVGLDVKSALHPQTLLAYEMNLQPLGLEHGGPLRLITALKYGYKSLKRIGLLRFCDERPRDYWVENQYDFYAGH